MFRIDAGTTTTAAELGNKFADPNKRKRKERIEIQPSKLNVDIHGITRDETRAWLRSRVVKACWAGLSHAVLSLCRGHDPCPVFVSSESSLVRKHLATYLRQQETLSVDFIGTRSVAHLIDHLGDRTELDRAQAMGHSRAVPYLDWWALANSADIVVRRHAGCIPQASTFSTTARAWGLDVERAARRARPDFDGLV